MTECSPGLSRRLRLLVNSRSGQSGIKVATLGDMDPAVRHALVIGAAALITTAIIRPAHARYRTWKNDPNRVQVAQRDWRGNYVPDLSIKRVERGLWLAAATIFALGCAIGWTVLTSPAALPSDGAPRITPTRSTDAS